MPTARLSPAAAQGGSPAAFGQRLGAGRQRVARQEQGDGEECQTRPHPERRAGGARPSGRFRRTDATTRTRARARAKRARNSFA